MKCKFCPPWNPRIPPMAAYTRSYAPCTSGTSGPVLAKVQVERSVLLTGDEHQRKEEREGEEGREERRNSQIRSIRVQSLLRRIRQGRRRKRLLWKSSGVCASLQRLSCLKVRQSVCVANLRCFVVPLRFLSAHSPASVLPVGSSSRWFSRNSLPSVCTVGLRVVSAAPTFNGL